MTWPLLSIITPVYNRAALVAQAIESVLAQDYPAVEHIVVDGGSTDGTLAVLARYPHLRVISRPDRGMYFALNDGLRLARGWVVTFLNSDDLYRPGALRAAVERLLQTQADAVAGQAVYFMDVAHQRRFFRPTRLLTPEHLWRELIYGDPAFNAWFFRRASIAPLGGLNTSYRIAGDREFLWRFALAGLRVEPLARVVYAYRVHSASLSLSPRRERFSAVANENLRLARTLGPRLPAEAQPWLRRMIVRETITAALRSAWAGQWRAAWAYARTGYRHDRAWPLRFGGRVLGVGWRWLGRRLGWYPPI